MLRLLRPGPLPKWVPIKITFSKPTPAQKARIGCWVLAWKRGKTVYLRPLFGGDVVLIESGGASVDVDGRACELQIREDAFLPIGQPGSPVRLTMNGQTVWE